MQTDEYIVEKENLRIDWEWIGEGFNGEYDENDPNDDKLMRFTLFKDGQEMEDASFCTNIQKDFVDEETLCEFSEVLFDVALDETNFKYKIEMASHMNEEMDKQELIDLIHLGLNA